MKAFSGLVALIVLVWMLITLSFVALNDHSCQGSTDPEASATPARASSDGDQTE